MFDILLADEMDVDRDDYRKYCNYYEITTIKECPMCHFSIAPVFLGDIKSETQETIYLIFMCPKCEKIFFAKYKDEGANLEMDYQLKDIYPKYAKDTEYEKSIKDISPMFVEIFNQAAKAEAENLNEICGMGYRKALEYLIKDYIISNNPDKEHEVKNELLGACINKMIDNPKIKKMAKGATWLGNDETHYIRRWKDKDIKDLKALINLTIYWIMYELKTKEYEEIMKL